MKAFFIFHLLLMLLYCDTDAYKPSVAYKSCNQGHSCRLMSVVERPTLSKSDMPSTPDQIIIDDSVRIAESYSATTAATLFSSSNALGFRDTEFESMLPIIYDGSSGVISFNDADYGSSHESSRKKISVLEGIDTNVIRVDQDEGGGIFVSFEFEKEASQHDIMLGKLPKDVKILAHSRIKRWWMAPSFGESSNDVPVETQLMLLELPQYSSTKSTISSIITGMSSVTVEDMVTKRYAIIAPLIDFDRSFRTTLFGREGGVPASKSLLAARCESGDPAVQSAVIDNALFVAAGTDPYELLDQAFAAISKKMGTFRTYAQKTVHSGVDDFGFCTWDAFYSSVDSEKVKSGLQSLIDSGTPAKFVIIDDGWQSTALSKDQSAKINESKKKERREDGELSGAQIDGSTAAEKMKESDGNPLLSMLTQSVGSFYKDHVEKGAPDSIAVKLWVTLSKTILREKLADFFAEQTDFSKRLTSWKANSKFEDASIGSSLKSFVATLKTQMGINHVFVWHALSGYWGGVSEEASDDLNSVLNKDDSLFPPTSKAVTREFSRPSPHLLLVEPALAWDPASLIGVGSVAKEKLEKMYSSMHAYLADAGVDGVKVDAQAGIGTFGVGNGGGAAIAKAAVRAVEKSVKSAFASSSLLSESGNGVNASADGSKTHHSDGTGRMFSSVYRRIKAAFFRTRADIPSLSPIRVSDSPVALVGCMCHSTENLYSYYETSLVRASDDFYPRDKAAQTVHLVSCAYNSVMLSQIGTCDWDMFHSKHEFAEMHAAARSISGGPVYVSDSPGNHDPAILKRLVLPNGQVLRCNKPAKPTVDCLFKNPTADGVTALKIWAPNNVGGSFGVFNVQGASWSRLKRKYDFHPFVVPFVSAEVKPRDALGTNPFGPDPFVDGALLKTVGKGMKPTDRFIVWSARHKKLTILDGRNAGLSMMLEPKGWDVVTMHRILQLGAPLPHRTALVDSRSQHQQNMIEFVAQQQAQGGIGRRLLGKVSKFAGKTINILVRPLLRPLVKTRQFFNQRRQRNEFRVKNRIQWAPIGLLDFFNCGGAITEILPSQTRREGTFRTKGEGVFGVFCNIAPRTVLVEGESVMLEYSESTQLCTFILKPLSLSDNLGKTDTTRGVILQW